MPQQVRHGLILVAVAAVVFCTRLGATRLWDDDETYFAQTAREMYERGDLVVPSFNQALFAHKPPFMYWMMMGAYRVFGVTEFAARFPSALFGIASVLLIWRLGRILYSPGVGFWAGTILATSLNFVVVARAATCDAELLFFCTLPIYLFIRGIRSIPRAPLDHSAAGRVGGPAGTAVLSSASPLSPSWLSYALVYGTMGVAMLVKGPIGVILPTAVLGVFVLWHRAEPVGNVGGGTWRSIAWFVLRACAPARILRTAWELRPLTALATVLLVAGPWFAMVGMKTQGEFLSGFFGVHHFHRFTSPMDNHGGPPLYYLLAICVGFFPWIVFFTPSCTEFLRRLRTDHPFRPADRLVSAWLFVWVGFFSVASTKFPHYVVPAYPALALMTAAFVERWTRETGVYGNLARRGAWLTVAVVGAGIMLVVPFVAQVHLPGEEWLGLAGLPLIPAAALAAHFTERGQITRALSTLTAGAIVFLIGLFGVAAVRVDRHQNTPALAQTIRHARPGNGARIGTFGYFRPGLVYYCNERVEQLGDAGAASAFLADERHGAFLVTTEAEYQRMTNLPAEIRVLQRAPWFLRSDRTLVLLGTPQEAVANALESGERR